MLSGPLAGFIVPPVLGTLSDNCQSTWGKRKPFVFWGGIFVLVSNILMAAAQDVASLLEGWLDDTDTATKIIAGVSIYILNFAMQPLALGLRTHAVDHFGPLEQSLVSLWVSRCSSLGSVFVALMAYTTSPPIIGLTITSSAVLALLLLVSLFMTPNIAYHQVNRNSHNHDGLRPFHRQLSRTLKCIRNLPPVIRKVCIIQLLAWFAWFPILNYASVYISQICRLTEASHLLFAT